MFKLVLEKTEKSEIKLPTSVGSLEKQESSRKTSQFSSVQSLSRVQLFTTAWTAAYQAPLSMGFSRQEYWSGRKAMPKNAQTTAQLHSSHMLVK